MPSLSRYPTAHPFSPYGLRPELKRGYTAQTLEYDSRAIPSLSIFSWLLWGYGECTSIHRCYPSVCCPYSPLNLLTMSPFPSSSHSVDIQLFENQSVVEYWENFATHAFENTTQSVYSHCILLKPSGAPVPATFCFSIRRDIFDLPSLVIGEH